MPEAMHSTFFYVAVAGLLLANLAGVFLVVLQLPGTWFMLLVTGVFAWWRWEQGTLGVWVLIGLVMLAVAGEIIEAVAGSAGAAKAGGSKRGAMLALVGGVAGAIIGSVAIPIPIIGTILGACLGAGAGSIAGDRWAGREWGPAMRAGQGAAIGKLWGTIGKIVVAVIMWAVTAIAIFWP
jgi:uncharacterized protein YqgC (DUF456 family)